jgi:serine phosphatase RsbU (regulator of sigma subunit)
MSSIPEPAPLRAIILTGDEQQAGTLLRVLRQPSRVRTGEEIEARAVPGVEELAALLNGARSDVVVIPMNASMPDPVGLLGEVRSRCEWLPVIAVVDVEIGSKVDELRQAGIDDCLHQADLSREMLVRCCRYAQERRLRMQAEAQLREAHADVAAAEVIHRRLLPRAAPEIAGFDIAGVCVPAQTVGGDLFDFLAFDRDSCLGVVADVSGHGLPAAILMTELHGLLHGLIEQNFDLVRIAEAAQQCVLRASQSHQFITMLLYRIDREPRRMSYVSAGHPGWILLRDGSVTELAPGQVPLGVDTDACGYRLQEHPLESGDIIVLPTDGIFESLGERQQVFGIDRMLSVIRQERPHSAREIVSSVVRAIQDFVSAPHPADDCTLVVMKVQ